MYLAHLPKSCGEIVDELAEPTGPVSLLTGWWILQRLPVIPREPSQLLAKSNQLSDLVFRQVGTGIDGFA